MSTIRRIAIIVREDAYDRVLTPFAFAYLAAASDIEVDMLFVNWAARLFSTDEQPEPSLSAGHAGEGEWLHRQVAAAGLPDRLPDLIHAVKATGKVHYYVCSLAAQIFGVNQDNLSPEADGIVGATWFVMEKAAGADYTQTF